MSILEYDPSFQDYTRVLVLSGGLVLQQHEELKYDELRQWLMMHCGEGDYSLKWLSISNNSVSKFCCIVFLPSEYASTFKLKYGI